MILLGNSKFIYFIINIFKKPSTILTNIFFVSNVLNMLVFNFALFYG